MFGKTLEMFGKTPREKPGGPRVYSGQLSGGSEAKRRKLFGNAAPGAA